MHASCRSCASPARVRAAARAVASAGASAAVRAFLSWNSSALRGPSLTSTSSSGMPSFSSCFRRFRTSFDFSCTARSSSRSGFFGACSASPASPRPRPFPRARPLEPTRLRPRRCWDGSAAPPSPTDAASSISAGLAPSCSSPFACSCSSSWSDASATPACSPTGCKHGKQMFSPSPYLSSLKMVLGQPYASKSLSSEMTACTQPMRHM
mmetsp:Transcript_31180/g.85463  ORF Transcript_31180/g.85463 Transcript_31180/m.85463 type:complete len:209 (-) Transcript_31180:581-1207(-)